jgi:hypothetical protein
MQLAKKLMPTQGALLILEGQPELGISQKWGEAAEELCKTAVAACIASPTLAKASQVSQHWQSQQSLTNTLVCLLSSTAIS